MQTWVTPKLVSMIVGKPLTVKGKQTSVLLSGTEPPVVFVNVCDLSITGVNKRRSKNFFMFTILADNEFKIKKIKKQYLLIKNEK
jgi:hypothetical protein